ncbi:MAG: hypothetical protein PHU63_03960, partial [Candidatus ainarchaeum sp.]|nr:hypothetical protein [Candidatus ainarchaeum sp.]
MAKRRKKGIPDLIFGIVKWIFGILSWIVKLIFNSFLLIISFIKKIFGKGIEIKKEIGRPKEKPVYEPLDEVERNEGELTKFENKIYNDKSM